MLVPPAGCDGWRPSAETGQRIVVGFEDFAQVDEEATSHDSERSMERPAAACQMQTMLRGFQLTRS